MSLLRRFVSTTRCALSSHIVRPCTSRDQRTYSTQVEDQGETRHVDFAAQLKSLLPNEQFMLSLDDSTRRKLDSIVQELEIYVYMGQFVPEDITDNIWMRLLNSDSVKDRVDILTFHAVKSRREKRDAERDNSRKQEHNAKLAEERDKFERGEMGYGPDLYQLIHNPMRNKKKLNIIGGSRIATSLRTGVPQVAVDLQYFQGERRKTQSLMATQLQYIISENFDARVPFPISLCNFNKQNQDMLTKMVGFYGGQYTDQTILPRVSDRGIKESFPKDKQIVYISKSARDMLDGPLTADVYCMCLSPDLQKESLGAARRAKIRAVRLPIQKYVKWQSGPMNIPYNNMMRILRYVYSSGGDWETALLNNIAKRHLMPEAERQELGFVAKRREKAGEKMELVRTICEATGHE